MKKPAILLADADVNFLTEISGPAGGMVHIEPVSDRKMVQLKIADKSQFYAALCINANICDPFAIPIVRFAKIHRPATPVYLIGDTKEKLPEQKLLDELHIHSTFVKPLQRNDLMNAIFPYTYFDVEKTIEIALKDQTAVDATLEVADGEMHAISAKDFLCGTKSFFDVCVRLSSGRYVKLLRAGDQFDIERVRSYIEKGVTHFYMKKEAQEFFLQYCDKVAEAILNKGQVASSVKVNQVVNFGMETMKFLTDRGFNDMTIQSAHQFVKHSNQLVKQLNPAKNPILKEFLGKISLCDHGSGTVMIVSMLLDELGYRDEKIVEVLSMSAFLHDIGLIHMPAHFEAEDHETLKDTELAEYEKHPVLGEQMLKGIRLMNPIVPQAVLQHHERRTRKGFPHKLGAGAISQVSEIVGISDTFNQLIRKAAKVPELDPMAELERLHFDDFSYNVIEAFRKIFAKKNEADVA